MARDILTEEIGHNINIKNRLREIYNKDAVISTCQAQEMKERTPYEAYYEFEEKAEAKKTGSHAVYLPHHMPEYKEICELHSEEERKLNAYREQCKNESLELFSKWFYSLGF